MSIHYADDQVTLHHADCRAVLETLPAASIDAVVTDPPYELGFMGKGWDASGIAYDVGMWAECLRVLRPGGYLLTFGGTRTYHRMACAVEDGGFEIRDCIVWLYGSGFPKSLDVSKAIDKMAGAVREVVGVQPNAMSGWNMDGTTKFADRDITVPATREAKRWSGWGTALKPGHEPIVVARKPLIGTVAVNVLAHGTGAMSIEGCRVGGRWPANVVLDAAAGAEVDRASGTLTSGSRAAGEHGLMGYSGAEVAPMPAIVGDSGGASRFFYCAKADTVERPRVDGAGHATVKPLDLMRWLIRLVTPPGGHILDPFAGSGTTAEAAVIEGFRCTTIELTEAHLPLILARITKPLQQVLDFGGVG